LLSEGYQQSELGQFAQNARDFVGLFFTTPPFSTNSSAFNFYRIDVASTDSGADDPAICGDASPGSGAMVRSYFDATFCGGGNRRVLTVNNDSVISVASAQVPGWDALFVLVNTFEYGGSGGPVAVASLSETSSLIHELGHSAFGLADEYDSYLGCGVDPVGTRDHHPAFEPVAANVTVQTDPSLVKWRSLFYPGIAIPTTVNANCAQCDSRPDPFPGQQRVGLYEGANYYHCEAYRPTYYCKMRALGADFCPVCIQRIMQVLKPYLSESVGDVNFDGCVDRADLTYLLAQLRARSSDPRYDLNGDGKVDIADARFLVLHFTNPNGSSCPP
jgi:hypothetical protein